VGWDPTTCKERVGRSWKLFLEPRDVGVRGLENGLESLDQAGADTRSAAGESVGWVPGPTERAQGGIRRTNEAKHKDDAYATAATNSPYSRMQPSANLKIRYFLTQGTSDFLLL
jgi:hypothetical protein